MKPPAPPLLDIRDLRVSVEKRAIVRGLTLAIAPGEIHAIMGPNGSGKSTLVNALMGHPAYTVTKGNATILGKSILHIDPSARAAAGLFLAFQYPRELAGVSLSSFLFAAQNALRAADPSRPKLSLPAFRKALEREMKLLRIAPAFAERSLNQGFSGGEKKKAEMLQLAMLRPKIALLDETDSGLDIDALRIVGEGVNRQRSKTFSALIVTHYARLLDHVRPDVVHVMVDGTIVESGGPKLAKELERHGYAKYGVAEEEGKIALN